MNNDHMINTIKYIQNVMPEPSIWAKQIEQYAKQHNVPIIDQVSLQLLLQLVYLKQPKTILEIGTAIAYSTLRIHEIVPDAQITSLEKNEVMYEQAIENVNRYAKNNNINIIHGDALDVIERFLIDKQFDFIFIDAAKSQYERYFNRVDPLLIKGGVIVTDNVLFRNLIASTNENIPRRYKTIVNRLREFNKQVMNNKNYHSSLIPIGDGLLISIKL